MSQFHFDPDTYMDLMRAEVPLYATLQATVARAAEAVAAATILDLGTGTGETLSRVLAAHPGATAIGVDENDCAAEAVAAATILDLGTGTGETLSRVLAAHPGATAIGVDENDRMLEVARGRLDADAVTLVVGDLHDPLPAGPFDLVVSALAIHHLDGPGKAELFGRIASVLAPGGRFVLGDVVVPDGAPAVTPLSDDYDKPSTVADQMQWLRQAGLSPAVLWQGDDLAVLTADRPS